MNKNPTRIDALRRALQDRILVLDGAMGTMIQSYELEEADFRGDRYADHTRPLKGNNDLLSLTRPDVIEAIHRAYLDAGCDILETNTFSGTRIAMADYAVEDDVYELNVESAAIARRAADDFTARQPDKPRFVAGVLGPTNRTSSMSPDVNDPSFRNVTFDELAEAYGEQARGLLDGGADMLLVETVFDTLNAKAALFAISGVLTERKLQTPVMVSGTITDASGRTLSGQTPEAFWNSVSHADLFSVGLNCALGAEQLRPHLEEIATVASTLVSCHPNAGLPNEFGQYDETPEHMAGIVRDFAESGFVNIVGGCCGTTPAHIQAIVDAVAGVPPRPVPRKKPRKKAQRRWTRRRWTWWRWTWRRWTWRRWTRRSSGPRPGRRPKSRGTRPPRRRSRWTSCSPWTTWRATGTRRLYVCSPDGGAIMTRFPGAEPVPRPARTASDASPEKATCRPCGLSTGRPCCPSTPRTNARSTSS